MFHFKSIVFVISFALVSTTLSARSRGENRRGAFLSENRREERENGQKDPDWMSLCKCAKPALRKMQGALADYAEKVSRGNVKRSSTYKPPALNAVIEKIKKIAYDCTKQSKCRCPEGYFKTNDGYHCLKISNKAVSCQEAVDACAKDVNARLAVAKDQDRLTDLADYIREIDPTDESHYWIGLSYNRTESGSPVWTWEDGTLASYSITKDLKNQVKKSLQLSILNAGDEAPRVIERVAISKNYKGTHWKQETCVDEKYSANHKYICEFLMFKLQIKAVASQSSQAASHAGKLH